MQLGTGLGLTRRHRSGGGGAAANFLRFAGAYGRVPSVVGNGNPLTLPISSLTAVGTTATAVVKSTITLFVGQLVQITGATPTAYNGYVTILTIPNGTSFTYTCASAPGGAGSGASVVTKLPNAGFPRSSISSSVTSSGTTATATFTNEAPLVGDQFLVTGASNDAFNGIVTLTRVGASDFDYTLPSSQAGATATGATFYPITAMFDGMAVEIPDVLGSGDWSELRVTLPNWCVALGYGSGTAGQGVIGAPGGFTITECSISVNGTAYAVVKFGGANTKVVNLNSGTSLIVSDAVTASDFIGTGVTLTRGTPIVIKAKITLHAFNSQMAGRASGEAGAGTPRTILYNNARTTTYSVGTAYTASAFTTTASAGARNGMHYYLNGSGQPFPAFNVIGRPTSNSAKSFLAIGDSITQKSNDSVNTDNTGATVANAAAGRLAWFSRSLWDTAFSNASAVAGMNCAVVGTQPTMYTTAIQGGNVTWFTDWMDYCTHFVDADGTNGFGGANKTTSESLWATAKGKGKTVVRTSLFPHTSSSSDSYTTAGGQVIFSGWGIGSSLDTQEGLWKTQTSDHVTYPNGPDYYLQFLSPRQSGGSDRSVAAYWQWVVNGTTNYATTDGLHPNPAIHVLMANEARTFWAGLP